MNTKCYTFYSYKGGSGRTTTLLNTTKHLADILGASKEHPILLVDADLESAGLTYFFNCETRFTARFNKTLHAASFLNQPKAVLTGIAGDNTFGISKERMFSCDALASRMSLLYPSMKVPELLSGVMLRETIMQVFEAIVLAFEEKNQSEKNKEELSDDVEYICRVYELARLFRQLGSIPQDDPDRFEKKRAIIETFLPADGMVDVSHYFGRAFGSIKFVGADVAYTGRHMALNNVNAANNKRTIIQECGKKGFSAILFDCSAGVQSSAHVLNHVSDVLVYCMRPTYQFVSGTYIQLERYSQSLQKIVNIKQSKAADRGETCDKKSVILLPTAVPRGADGTMTLQNDSFERIHRIASLTFSTFVDNTFSSYEKSLKEISLFKWREYILGTEHVVTDNWLNRMTDDTLQALKVYASYETMPADAKEAYNTYRLLAERLCYNT